LAIFRDGCGRNYAHMPWFRHVRRPTSLLKRAEYMELRRISAILDTKVANVQYVGGMSDGNREHLPLRLWQNHWSTGQQSPPGGRSASICHCCMACSAPGCPNEGHKVRKLQPMVDIYQTKSSPGVCRCREMLYDLAV
jgi:hypothetical protein